MRFRIDWGEFARLSLVQLRAVVSFSKHALVQLIAVLIAALAMTGCTVWSAIMWFWEMDKLDQITDTAMKTVAGSVALTFLETIMGFLAIATVLSAMVTLGAWNLFVDRWKYWRFIRKGGVGEYWHLYKNGQIPLYEYFVEKDRREKQKSMS